MPRNSGNKAQKLKEMYPSNVFMVFIAPPAPEIEAFSVRLKNRGTSSEEVERRMKRAQNDLSCAAKYDKVVINHNLDLAVKTASDIVSEILAKHSSSHYATAKNK